jgi:hypothetical protein
MRKIGVFVCHCGNNIAGVVNVPQVVEEAGKLPDVAHAVDYKYLCSEPGQKLIREAIAEKGPDAAVAFPNTAYYLPVMLGMLGREVSKLGEIKPVLEHAKTLLHPAPDDRLWTPYLGETLDCGMATLLAAEAIEAIEPTDGTSALGEAITLALFPVILSLG